MNRDEYNNKAIRHYCFYSKGMLRADSSKQSLSTIARIQTEHFLTMILINITLRLSILSLLWPDDLRLNIQIPIETIISNTTV